MEATTLDVSTLVTELRATFSTGKTRPLAWRKAQLLKLKEGIAKEEERILEALKADLGKPACEAYAGEIGFLLGDIDHTVKHLRKWMKPQKVKTPLHTFKAVSRIYREPLGVVLIIGPWNYPFQLVLAPLIGALAAGNCAVLKPSELTPHTSKLVADLIKTYMEPDAVRVVEGGVPETTALLEQQFDHIFFTGSERVGKIVMAAAAKHLTPVTLELGGKSPCIVDQSLDMEVTARRIVWGKFFNAGQTCVAPDYVLVHESQEEPLLEALKSTLTSFYGEDPKASPDFARIVNGTHHERLTKLLEDQEVVVGGQHDADQRYLAPTILRNVSPEAPVMADEIFGPILPVLKISQINEAIEFVNARPKPLALYMFSSNEANQRAVLAKTSSGGACLNDTISHLAVPDLPFGGVGNSGMGAYHGHWSFETFSHRKSVLDRATWIDVRLRYPPYEGTMKWLKRLLG